MAKRRQQSSTQSESDRIAKEVESVYWLHRSKFCNEKGYYSTIRIESLDPKEYRKCESCNGTGSFYMERDLHKSGGIVPCGCASGTIKTKEVRTWYQKKLK